MTGSVTGSLTTSGMGGNETGVGISAIGAKEAAAPAPCSITGPTDSRVVSGIGAKTGAGSGACGAGAGAVFATGAGFTTGAATLATTGAGLAGMAARAVAPAKAVAITGAG